MPESQPEIAQVVCSAQAAAEADEHYDPFKDPKRRPSRSKDPAWKYAFWPELQGSRLLLQCNLCGKRVSSGPLRMKKHLAGGYTVVTMCPKTTPAIQKEMREYLKTHSFAFKNLEGAEAREEEGDEDAEQEKGEASSKASNANTSGKRKPAVSNTHLTTSGEKKKGKSIADQIRKTPEEVIAERHMSKGTHIFVCLQIHSRLRNRLEYKRMNKFSYVSYNRKMEARFQNLREQGSKSNRSTPLILEEFQWDNEWVDINSELVHEHQAQVMDGDTPLTWSQVDEAMGASSSIASRSFLRRARGDPSEPIARPIGPYITYTRNHSRTRLVVHDEELREELHAAEYDQDMDSDDEDEDAEANGHEDGFELDEMELEA